MTPSEYILRKSVVTQGEMSSADWDLMDTAIKERAFISSRVESVNFLDTCRSRIADLLENRRDADSAFVSRARVVSDIMRAARDAGIARGTASLKDPGSYARANVIIDTNAGMAAGYVQAELANSHGARMAFPAQELLRFEEREKPREWKSRWIAAGGKLYGDRMIALKGDPIWINISRFGKPYPPFDFNSGMGVEDVSYDEAVDLGVIQEDYEPPEKSPLADFNDKLEMSMEVPGPESDRFKEMQKTFGDQIQYNPHTRKMYFDGSMIHDVVKQIRSQLDAGLKQTTVKAKPSVGRPSAKFCAEASTPPDAVQKQLRLSPSNLFHVLQDHVGKDKDSRNVALIDRELTLIGHVWRNPDSVDPAKDGYWMLTRTASDGNLYRLVVSRESSGGFVFHTFYKEKAIK